VHPTRPATSAAKVRAECRQARNGGSQRRIVPSAFTVPDADVAKVKLVEIKGPPMDGSDPNGRPDMDDRPTWCFATWNIQFGLGVDEAVEILRDWVLFARLDVLCAQELDDEGAARLAAGIGFDHGYLSSGTHVRSRRPFGNAILTRHGLTKVRGVDLPGRAPLGGHPRIALAADVSLGGRNFAVYSAHTEIPTLPLAFRRRQFAALGTAARADPSPVMVGGDFNTITARGRRALESDLAVAGLTPLMGEDRASTCFRGGVGFVLDHFFGRGVKAVASGTVGAGAASDHDLVWVSVRPDPGT